MKDPIYTDEFRQQERMDSLNFDQEQDDYVGHYQRQKEERRRMIEVKKTLPPSVDPCEESTRVDTEKTEGLLCLESA